MWWAAAPGKGFFTQVSSIAIEGGKYQCDDPAVICKSVNSDILIDGAEVAFRLRRAGEVPDQ